MEQPRFTYLLDQYILGEISPEGREELATMAGQEAYAQLLDEVLMQELRQQPLTGLPPDHRVKQRLLQRLPGHDFWPEAKQPRRLYLRWAAAAAVVTVLATGSWLLLNRGKTPAADKGTAITADIGPAGNKAVLTLENGRRIILEQTANGAIAQEGGTRIIKLNNGRLLYQSQPLTGTAGPVSFNTLSTPRGGQIQLVLPDGTAVWLNSASSLRYPAVFKGAERIVELTGEAYFEVAPDARQPFKVKLNGMLVDVLGTSFNIHAYTDEPVVTTTLVQGSVRVTNQYPKKEKSKILTPGEQAVVSADQLLTQQADLEQVLSWKNGLFVFEDRKLADILREIARWYDIDIENRAPLSGERYGGIINRHNTLAKVVELLQQNGIQHFKIEGRKLIVLP